MRTEILGSPSALSLAAATNPAVLPIVAFVGGIAVLGAVAQFGFQKFKDYQKEKHDASIRKIIAIWEETLAHIAVPDYVENIGLPPIFHHNEEDDTYETMHFTEAQVRAMASTALGSADDPTIVRYKENIIEAIRTLKDYYAIHSDKTCITVLVTQYLLNILESKCLHFQGYTFDIALINAIIRFNYTFASLEGEDAQRVEFLTKVNRALKRAKRELELHQKTRTQPEIVNALLGACRSAGDQLIRILAKIITPHEYWESIENQTLDELQKGIVVSRHRRRILGPIAHESDPIRIPTTFMNAWFREMISYYLETMDPNFSTIKVPVLSLFSIPKEFTKEQKKQWRAIFADSENFVTRELNAVEKYVPVRAPSKIIARLNFVADIGKLLHLCCSFQFMLTGLSRYIKMFGQYQVDNPGHCINMYHLLDKLSHELTKQIDHVQTEFDHIEASNNDTMRMVLQEECCNAFASTLKLLRTSVTSNMAAIKNCRRNFNTTSSHQTPQAAEHALISHVSEIMHIYGILIPPVEQSIGNNTAAPVAETEEVVTHESDTGSEVETIDESTQAGATTLPAEPTGEKTPPSQPQITVAGIRRIYENHAGFFNASKKIFQPDVDQDTVIASMRLRANKKPGGASEKTLVDLGLSEKAASTAMI